MTKWKELTIGYKTLIVVAIITLISAIIGSVFRVFTEDNIIWKICAGAMIVSGFTWVIGASCYEDKMGKPVCRRCGFKGDMVITYGDNTGVCHKCLDEILNIPGILKPKQ